MTPPPARLGESVPEFGTWLLDLILVGAAYGLGLALRAGIDRPRLWRAARHAAYATTLLVCAALLLLAYAFITHDFRIRYVADYSDRSMSTLLLVAAVWAGQDGSLLWWLLLTSLHVPVVAHGLRRHHPTLGPWVLVVLMLVVGWLGVTIRFAANPFELAARPLEPDGSGLNPLLRSGWMMLHPPALYIGFVACAVPFACALGGLIWRQASSPWPQLVQRWMLWAWVWLTVGNLLGMVWAYQELGWGGYWGWDPVENTSLLPWLTATAYLHLAPFESRQGLFRKANLALLAATFLLTLLATALTRSGVLSSVHSFARSMVGPFFAVLFGAVCVGCLGLGLLRRSALRSSAREKRWLGPETAAVTFTTSLIGLAALVLGAVLYPILSEAIGREKASVRPEWFTLWVLPCGLVAFILMGLCPLLSGPASTHRSLERRLRFPVAAAVLTGLLHVAFGRRLGMPALVETVARYPAWLEPAFGPLRRALPLLAIMAVAFNLAVVLEQLALRGKSHRSAADRSGQRSLTARPAVLAAAPARWGAVVVHLGMTLMLLGFCGSAWNVERQVVLSPGEQVRVGPYEVSYLGVRHCPGESGCAHSASTWRDKRAVFCDLELRRAGVRVGHIAPATFVYRGQPQRATAEAGLHSSWRDDFYAILGGLDPRTGLANLELHVNPLVVWVWIGGGIAVLGGCLRLARAGKPPRSGEGFDSSLDPHVGSCFGLRCWRRQRTTESTRHVTKRLEARSGQLCLAGLAVAAVNLGVGLAWGLGVALLCATACCLSGSFLLFWSSAARANSRRRLAPEELLWLVDFGVARALQAAPPGAGRDPKPRPDGVVGVDAARVERAWAVWRARLEAEGLQKEEPAVAETSEQE